MAPALSPAIKIVAFFVQGFLRHFILVRALWLHSTCPPLLQQVQAEPAPTVAPVVAPMPRGSDAGASSTARPQGAPGPAHDRLALERQYKQKAPWRCISMTCGNVNATSVFVCQKCGRDALKFFRCTAKVKSLPCGNRQPAILQCCLKCHAPVKLP